MTIVRLLTEFTADSSYRVNAVDISHISIEHLKQIFCPPDEDPLMYDCYRLTKEQAQAMQPFLQHKLDSQKYEYYIEVERLS